MQNETDWVDTSEESKQRYSYMTRPEPLGGMEEIKVETDSILGKIRTRYMSIGDVRNSKEENKRRVKVYLDPYPHIRTNAAKELQGWYKGAEEKDTVRPRPCFSEAILTSPYQGYCHIGCHFCYINSGHFRPNALIKVPMNYGKQIAKQISKMNRSAAGYFSSFTEPFLGLEPYYHNTQQGAQAFVDAGLPIFFLSRRLYPDWAIELLKKNKYSYAQKSINTPDPKQWKILSPGAASLEDHLKDIEKLHSQGIYVSIQCNPIIPGVVNHIDVCTLFKKLKKAGADHVIIKFVEASYSWAEEFKKKIFLKHGDEAGEKFARLFTQNIGGQKTIAEEYRMEGHRIYSNQAKKLGLTYATCYEYRLDKNADGTPRNKTGISVGREFTTSEQCHGQRVPMFYRDLKTGKFKEVEECPPSGCLYCAAENDGEPRCGDALAGEAKALKLVDLKIPFNLK